MLKQRFDGPQDQRSPLLGRRPGRRATLGVAVALGVALALAGPVAGEVTSRDAAATSSGAFAMDPPEGFELGVDDADTPPLPEGTGDSALTELPPQAAGTLINPFTLIGQAAIAGARDAIGFGNLAYVCGDSGISVFDVTNPAQPQFVRTVGNLGIPVGVCRIRGNELVALGAVNVPQAEFLSVSTYSLANPEDPQLLGSTPQVPYNFAADLLLTNTHAFVTTLGFAFFLGSNDIFAHFGDLLAFDIANPSAPQLVDVLLNTNGTNTDGVGKTLNIDLSGGNINMWNIAQPDAQTLLVASSTATGGDPQTGTGIVRVIDISDPANLAQVGTLPIPGAVQLIGLALEGNRAFVTASSGGWQDFFNNNNAGLTGNIVLATLDVSSPRNPQLIATQTLSRRSRGVNFAVPLGSGRYAFSSLGSAPAGETPQLFLVDAGDPVNLNVGSIGVPAEILHMNAADNRIYTASNAGFLIYRINGGADGDVVCRGVLVTIAGTDGPDNLAGTAARDVIAGLGGNDRVNGAGGNDLLCGDAGNDTLSGGAGNDSLFGGAGRDRLKGAAGRDRLDGAGGNDKLSGGGGRDTCKGGPGTDTASGCERVTGVP